MSVKTLQSCSITQLQCCGIIASTLWNVVTILVPNVEIQNIPLNGITRTSREHQPTMSTFGRTSQDILDVHMTSRGSQKVTVWSKSGISIFGQILTFTRHYWHPPHIQRSPAYKGQVWSESDINKTFLTSTGHSEDVRTLVTSIVWSRDVRVTIRRLVRIDFFHPSQLLTFRDILWHQVLTFCRHQGQILMSSGCQILGSYGCQTLTPPGRP